MQSTEHTAVDRAHGSPNTASAEFSLDNYPDGLDDKALRLWLRSRWDAAQPSPEMQAAVRDSSWVSAAKAVFSALGGLLETDPVERITPELIDLLAAEMTQALAAEMAQALAVETLAEELTQRLASELADQLAAEMIRAFAAETLAEERAVRKEADQRAIQERTTLNRLAKQRAAQQKLAVKLAAKERAAQQKLAEKQAAEERAAQERAAAEERAAQARAAKERADQEMANCIFEATMLAEKEREAKERKAHGLPPISIKEIQAITRSTLEECIDPEAFPTCDACGESFCKLLQCPCRQTAYCSKKCQKTHWKLHKVLCTARKIV